MLHAVGHAFQDGTKGDLSAWDPKRAVNLFAGHTVYSIVLEVADEELLPIAGADRKIDVWAVAFLATEMPAAGAPSTGPAFRVGKESITAKPSKAFPYVPPPA